MIACGTTTAEIAARLCLSAHTVRDYGKTIFEKVGVSTRGELVAKLFAEHYAPTHLDPSNVEAAEYEGQVVTSRTSATTSSGRPLAPRTGIVSQR
jgi:hypothetical protein